MSIPSINWCSEKVSSLIRHLNSSHSEELSLTNGAQSLSFLWTLRSSFPSIMCNLHMLMVESLLIFQERILTSQQKRRCSIASLTRMMSVNLSKSQQGCSKVQRDQYWQPLSCRKTLGCIRQERLINILDSSWRKQLLSKEDLDSICSKSKLKIELRS